LTVAECNHAGDGDAGAKVQELLVGILTSGKGGVLLLATDIWTVERARDLRWKHSLNFKAVDAIHIASAIESGCDELITWDGIGSSKKSILSQAGALNAQGIKVRPPDKTTLIPQEYLQRDT